MPPADWNQTRRVASGLWRRTQAALDTAGVRDFEAELDARFARVRTNVGAYGVDPFGFDPSFARKFASVGARLYRHYFRVACFGIDQLPQGRCLLVANHSGQLPYDGMMIAMACFLQAEPPRAVRSMVDRFVPSVPFVSPALARLGQVLGTPDNCRRLLASEEVIQCFPEGTGGLNKTYDRRYRLQRFGHGFMRLALQMRAPVVPVAVVGAEEQAPSLANVRSVGKLLGLPALPITPAPLFGALPLPVRYRLHFGAPIDVCADDERNEHAVARKVKDVKTQLQALLDAGVAARSAVFW